MRNAEIQGRVVCRTTPAFTLRIPHSAFRTRMVTSLPLTPVLVGPTAVGKTAVVTAWAECESITVVSADARQVYRGLDIGTAKPSRTLLTGVPHLGLDVVQPGERYSAGRFARGAAQWLGQIRGSGRQPVVVGGTGLYVRALAEGLFHEPSLDAARRERLRAWTADLTPARLAHWAARLDRRFGGGGRQRAGRAVEVALLTGRGLSWWQEHARTTGAMRPWYIQLTLPRDALHRRIAQRVDEMLAAGLVDEVRRGRPGGGGGRGPGGAGGGGCGGGGPRSGGARGGGGGGGGGGGARGAGGRGRERG